MTTSVESPAVKCTLNLGKLQRALSLVAPAVPHGSSVLPVLQSVRISQSDSGLSVEGTDLDLAIRATVAEITALDRAIIVPAAPFTPYIKALSGDQVKMTADSSRAHLTCGGAKALVPVLSSAPWPNEKFHDVTDNPITYPQSVLSRGLKIASIASGDDSRYTLNTVLLDGDGVSKLRMIATNGNSMIVYTTGDVRPINLLIPSRMVKVLTSLLGSDGNVNLANDDKTIVATIPSEAGTVVSVACHKVSGTFPRWEGVMPNLEQRHTIGTDASELLEAIERCLLLGNAETSAVVLKFDSEGIQINSNDPRAGEAEERVSCSNPPTDTMRIGVNASFIVPFLKKVSAAGVVRIALPDNPQSSLAISAVPCEGDTATLVVMPIRI
jgi:DNA polymerase III sliding clamp (beta) subunit (PCNA family)